MKKYRAQFFLNSGNVTYYLVALNAHEATVAAQKRCDREHGRAQQGEDLNVHVWDGEWAYAEWPENCSNPYGLPCACGGRSIAEVQFITREQVVEEKIVNKTFIIRWSGDCQVEAATLEAAIEQIKKNDGLMCACSRFDGREIEGEKK